jgi:tetratricopeptide (TPR) repeat protein
MAPLQGKTLSHFRILEKIGAGGMGEVYRAFDERLERDVALKVLPSGTLVDEISRKRFRKEALALSKLNHPNIATVHDFDTQEGVDFLVMEYVAGETLGEKLRVGPLSEKEIARLGVELADGLAAAHGQGVIHRDLKPGNIRLMPEGRLKILDFGLAKLTPPSPGADVTRSVTQSASLAEAQGLLGTLPYMAPEQLRGEGMDARSDIWAAGLVLYELASGRRAFPEAESGRLVAAILEGVPPPPSVVNQRTSSGLDSIIAKCLEKDPERRYQTAKELAVDLRRLGTPSSERGVSVDQGTRRRWWIAAAAAVLTVPVLVLAWGQGWFRGDHPRSPLPAKKAWVLVAEFEGPPDDSSLAVATRDLVSAALDQSEIVATVPREQIRLALQNAGKPANTRVDAELAKELAYRSAVRAVVEGKISRLGPGYSAVLRVVDAESLKVVLTERGVAKNEDALVPTLGRLAEKLRTGLGERRSAIQATRPMHQVATPSFEAYRVSVHAWGLTGNGHDSEAIPLFRDAIALDPDFASAWAGLGNAFYNINQPDSSLAALSEALKRPQRLTTIGRIFFEATRAFTEGDLKGALAAYEHILQYDRSNLFALWNRALVFGGLGRLEEALESTRMAERASPFGVSQGLRHNEVGYLCRLGRVDEARVVAQYLTGPLSMRQYIEVAACNWAAVERMSDSLLADLRIAHDYRADALLDLASAQAARGAFKSAAATFERTEETARAAALPMHRHAAYRGRVVLAHVSRGAIPIPEDAWTRDSSAAAFITRGLRTAMAGDGARAENMLHLARTRSRGNLAWHGAAPSLLQARIEALRGRWGEVARILSPIASQRVEIGENNYPAAMSVVRWLLADAYEQLGQADSAAATLERVTSEPMPSHWEQYARGIVVPFAHRRLVLLYSRMDRLEDARRHWRIFTEMVRTPDPEIQPLIAEARAALRSAEEAAAKRGSRA